MNEPIKINSLISSEYIPLLVEYHESGHGISGERHSDRIARLLNALDAHSLLDYGCGQGTLVNALRRITQEVDFTEYDPGVSGKDSLPDGLYDFVACTDVLEHIEPDKLDAVLNHINSLVIKGAYLVISTCAASLNLSDGRNAHLIVKSGDWWPRKIKAIFEGYAVTVDHNNSNEIAIIIDKTKPSDSTQKIVSETAESQGVKIVNDSDFFDLWHGRPCLIIGSGKNHDYQPFNPALNEFPGKRIGCNTAFTVGYNVDMIMFIDKNVIEQHGEAMAGVDCFKLSIACDPPAPWNLHGNDIHWLKARQPERFSCSFDSGLYPADLTGFLALNTAILMGCNPVWLYGFESREHQYHAKMERFRWAADWAGANGREIYVADEDSSLVREGIFEYKPLPISDAGEDIDRVNPTEGG